MSKEQLGLFAGRQEAVVPFERLTQRQAGEPRSFLPILGMVAPSGYGKSLFMQIDLSVVGHRGEETGGIPL